MVFLFESRRFFCVGYPCRILSSARPWPLPPHALRPDGAASSPPPAVGHLFAPPVVHPHSPPTAGRPRSPLPLVHPPTSPLPPLHPPTSPPSSKSRSLRCAPSAPSAKPRIWSSSILLAQLCVQISHLSTLTLPSRMQNGGRRSSKRGLALPLVVTRVERDASSSGDETLPCGGACAVGASTVLWKC
ncbi:wiskott-Aldrich syndrome protein family member 1-like [Setaria italica]|uniref:wiskott-Aldrich syndrome protein family member 1-like n=1 Tax=Setaria italica TaxID=4555 RepID=UPI000BE53870|nr:wiskott-Aldrich syndrome protein family member 1-like [Setaria italica]